MVRLVLDAYQVAVVRDDSLAVGAIADLASDGFRLPAGNARVEQALKYAGLYEAIG